MISKVVFVFLILTTSFNTYSCKKENEEGWGQWVYDNKCTLIGAGVGLVAAPVAAPGVIAAAGFTKAGIAAGSLAAKVMSAAAVANGGGVAAGGTIATLQSMGAAGLGSAATTVTSAVGGIFGAMCGKATCTESSDGRCS